VFHNGHPLGRKREVELLHWNERRFTEPTAEEMQRLRVSLNINLEYISSLKTFCAGIPVGVSPNLRRQVHRLSTANRVYLQVSYSATAAHHA
jgi:hypothetical protein